MLPKVVNLLLRIAGLIVTAILLIQPWLVANQSADPFVLSGWSLLFAGLISIFSSSVILAFYRPHKGYVPITTALLVLFISFGISLFYSNYTASLRVTMLCISGLACIGFLRLSRKNEDNITVAGMVSVDGFFMAVYAICQSLNYDFLIWESKYKVVGTLSNPNFLGIFLCVTAAITLGLVAELYRKNKKDSLIFLGMLLTQLAVIVMINKPGCLLTFAFMAVMWCYSKRICLFGKMSRRSTVISGVILTIILLVSVMLIHSALNNYPWDKLTKVSYGYQTIVSRLVLWQMGLNIFATHPVTGLGLGTLSYAMSLQRHPTSSVLGLNGYNDDPHSFIITSLAETGIIGFTGLCILLVSIFGCYIRNNSKSEKLDSSEAEAIITENFPENPPTIDFAWSSFGAAAVIVYLSLRSGYIKPIYLPVSISFLILFFGISTYFLNKKEDYGERDYNNLSRGSLTAITGFCFYCLFNNSFSIVPLSAFMILIMGLHYSSCLPEVKWKSRITFISLAYIFLPLVFTFSAYNFQRDYVKEQANLSNGALALRDGRWNDAENNFEAAIKLNPQSFKAYHGLALALDSQGKPEEAQEILSNLDNMVPNVFKAKYEIARILFENNKILEAHSYAIKNLKYAKDPLSYELLGNILLVEGRQKEAEDIFVEGLKNKPATPQEVLAADRMRLSLAAITSNRGDFKSCQEYMDKITTEVSKNLDAMYIKGMLLSRKNKDTEALAIFEEALNQYPHIPRLMNAVGYLLMKQNKNLDRAQVLLERAFLTAKSNEQVNQADFLMITNSLGKLYHKQNKLKEAGELLRLSYEQTPSEWGDLKQERLKDLNDFYDSFGQAQR